MVHHGRLRHNQLEHRQANEKPEVKTYYWILGVSDETGRRIIYGYKPSYQEAQLKASSIHNATTEIVALKTRDENSASRQLRALVLDETNDIDESFKKFKHVSES